MWTTSTNGTASSTKRCPNSTIPTLQRFGRTWNGERPCSQKWREPYMGAGAGSTEIGHLSLPLSSRLLPMEAFPLSCRPNSLCLHVSMKLHATPSQRHEREREREGGRERVLVCTFLGQCKGQEGAERKEAELLLQQRGKHRASRNKTFFFHWGCLALPHPLPLPLASYGCSLGECIAYTARGHSTNLLHMYRPPTKEVVS